MEGSWRALASDPKIELVETIAFTYPFLLFEVAPDFCTSELGGKNREGTKAMNRDKKHRISRAMHSKLTNALVEGGRRRVASIEAK